MPPIPEKIAWLNQPATAWLVHTVLVVGAGLLAVGQIAGHFSSLETNVASFEQRIDVKLDKVQDGVAQAQGEIKGLVESSEHRRIANAACDKTNLADLRPTH